MLENRCFEPSKKPILESHLVYNMSFRADLHCHTTCSDGMLTPQELVLKAKSIGLSGLSITDHDTIEAYAVAKPLAREHNLLLGHGAEFSCLFQDLSVHMLAYDFDLKHEGLKSLCESHRHRRFDRNRIILDKLKRLKMPIEEYELNEMGHMIGRPHIAQQLVKKGYVSSIKEAFQLYIGDGKPCFFRGPVVTVEETMAIIHAAEGKAFLAHPHLIKRTSKIKELLKLPFDGIECHYARLLPEREKRWITIAKEKGLLISGGSDFHGAIREHSPLGSSWVDEESFHKIFSKHL